MLISDHLNLTAISPLRGATFVDLTDLYSPRLRAAARQVDPALPEGVYAQLPGPHYETPAEIRMLRTLGADLVGMSTTLEAIAARAAGLEVLGLSLVTNLAAGMSGQPLDHAEVLEAGRAAADRHRTPARPTSWKGCNKPWTSCSSQVDAWIADDPDPAHAARAGGAERPRRGRRDRHSTRCRRRASPTSPTASPARSQFGTAGLRGAVGAGPNRMNRAVVIRAAAGLARPGCAPTTAGPSSSASTRGTTPTSSPATRAR